MRQGSRGLLGGSQFAVRGISGARFSVPAVNVRAYHIFLEMRTIALVALLVGSANTRPAHSVLQPLPKHFDAGDASVVFIKDRLNVLPEGFGHHEVGVTRFSSVIDSR